LAEFVCVGQDRAIVSKPDTVTFGEAAAVPVAGITALQGLGDKGGLQAGQKVLINGASGGVGTFSVQIAKAMGGEVTAVCSDGKVDSMRSIGADHVINYSREDFSRGGEQYNLILDIAGNRSWSDYKRVLEPSGKLVIIGGPKGNRLFGPLGHVIGVRVASVASSQNSTFFIAHFNLPDMEILRGLLASGKIRSVVTSTYQLGEIVAALREMGEGHAAGKIVINIS
jgi:NADPH:quinone reductase-like Zn-dependent oxidoreductase